MWVACLQENLSRGLATVGRAVASRATLPVTQNVLLQTDKSRLKITATNLEIAISTWVGAQVEREGAITVPARMLTDFVNSLPGEQVDIDLSDEPKGIHLRCANFEARMNGTDADEFPPIPTVTEGDVAKIPADALRVGLERVVFAAATEESRPVLTGVKVEIEGNEIVLAAADGFRLAVDRGKLSEPIESKVDVIVPAKTMNEVHRLIGDQDDDVVLTVTEAKSQALFRLENVEIVSQLVQGTFPDYDKLIPASFGTKATVGLPQFRQAARAASIFARDGSGIIRLVVMPGEDDGPGKMTISSHAEEMGENEGTIEVKVEGDESKVAFNSKFLLDVLGVLGGDEVTLDTTTPSSPGVLRAAAHEGYVHVVMPMFVQW